MGVGCVPELVLEDPDVDPDGALQEEENDQSISLHYLVHHQVLVNPCRLKL